MFLIEFLNRDFEFENHFELIGTFPHLSHFVSCPLNIIG